MVLSGWREQGIQVVDLKTRKVTQTLLQDCAFYGAAFSQDGHTLYVSGDNTDTLFVYAWRDGTAQDLNEKNPQNTAAARMSEGLDLSAPDVVGDQVYNRILWLMLKGDVPLRINCDELGGVVRCGSYPDGVLGSLEWLPRTRLLVRQA